MLGCVPDPWMAVPTRDAGDDVPTSPVTDVVPMVDTAPVVDTGPTCACPSGQICCDEGCMVGPTALYRGEGSTDDSTGGFHALRGRVDYAAGRVGQAFLFGGDSEAQYVELPSRVGELGDGDFTLSLWFNSGYTAGNQSMLARRAACWNTPPYSGFDVRLAFNGGLFVELWTTVANYALTSPTGFNDRQWHHLAIVREGAEVRLHVDGETVSTRTIAGSMNDPTRTPIYLGVGRCVPNAPGNNTTADTTHWFDGRLDEVAVYDRALQPAELTATGQGRCVR